MPKKKAILFIDGSNFYHGLKQNNFFNSFSYKSFFEELLKEFDIQKVYFYDAIKSRGIEQEQYSKQQAFHEHLRKEIPAIVIRTRKLKYLGINDRVEKTKKNTNFCKDCKPKLEKFLQNAGLTKSSKEKGIDILLVTDMIKGAFQEQFQTALLATGDADYVPAVELVQTLKKEVINLHFYAGSSGELRNICNSHKLIQADAKGKCYFK
ncbi:MAG: NYN domain-containing protein [archaeon]|nr:NYN domain-containing protein [archaeon]